MVDAIFHLRLELKSFNVWLIFDDFFRGRFRPRPSTTAAAPTVAESETESPTVATTASSPSTARKTSPAFFNKRPSKSYNTYNNNWYKVQ